MTNLPLCVLGAQIGTNAGRQIKAELYGWLTKHFDVTVVNADETAKNEYTFIKKAIELAIEKNAPVLYIHTKGACNVLSKAYELNVKTGVQIPSGALPHDSQIIVRRMWKHEFTKNYDSYLKLVEGDEPIVACPYTGGDKTTWHNAFVINPSAARLLKQTFHYDNNRYYYERMFEHTKIQVVGIRSNCVERDKNCQSNMWQDIWNNFFVSHPFNIISNNCFGGFIYKHLRMQYNNPFIFSMVHYGDMVNLVTHSLNWGKIEVEHTRGQRHRNSAYDVVVDNQVRIHYEHYLEDGVHEPPIRKDCNVLGKDIHKYVVEKYFARAERMFDEAIQPYFVVSWHPSSGTLSDINNLVKTMNQYSKKYCVIMPPDIKTTELHDVDPSNILISPCVRSDTWVKNSADLLHDDIISRICAIDMISKI